MKARTQRKSPLRGAATKKVSIDTNSIYANRAKAAPPNRRAITAEQCAPLAKMLPNPLSPEELKDWLNNAAARIAHQKAVDEINHKKMQKAWNRIGANMRESQKLLGAFGDLSNVAPLEMRELKFVHDFLEVQDPLLDGLHSIEKWAGTYLNFLEKLARERRGGCQPWEQWGYTLLIHVWIANGGKPICIGRRSAS